MRRLACLALALALLAVPAPAPAVQRAEPIRIMLLGDSIPAGYGSPGSLGVRPQLSRHLVGIDHLFTSGGSRSGWTVQEIRSNAIGWLNVDRPDVVVLLIGTNNAAGVPPGMGGFDTAYADLVNVILGWSADVKLIVSTIPYSRAAWSPNEVTVNVAVITKGGWHPSGRVRLAYGNRLHPCFLTDNVHPSVGGYTELADLIAVELLPALGHPAPPIAGAYTDERPGYERRPDVPSCRNIP